MNLTPTKLLCRAYVLPCVICLLAVCSTAQACPTNPISNLRALVPNTFNNNPNLTVYATENTRIPAAPKTAVNENKWLQPSCFSNIVSENAPSQTTHLPHVPAAIFMAISGFLCVTFVRDRRAWIAGLGALLWLGQTSVQAIPQLVIRLTSKTSLICLSKLNTINKIHQGKNDAIFAFYQPSKNSQILSARPNSELNCGKSFSAQKLIIFQRYYQTEQQNNHYAHINAQSFYYYSPAFGFQTIPRGPPIPA